MEVLYSCCCGLDVHKKTVVACLLRVGANGQGSREVQTFTTMTDDLLALAEWLTVAGCTHVAMESTGVYWKPVYNILEDQFEVMVVNAAHIKAVPGRKTDIKDAEWIADLLQHGLVRPSFIPDRPQRELRDLTRTRTALIDERSAAVNRLQKVLEDANLKVASVVTDVMGVSGRAMVEALLQGTTDPAALAELAKGRLRAKRAELERALAGRISTHHRLLLTTHLAHVDFLDEEIARLSAEIAQRLRPVADEMQRLDTIPGVDRQTAEVLLAELGTELARFPSAAHLASWAGMCPGNHESAGKQRSGRTRKGSKWLRRTLIEAACGAVRTKQAGRTALAGQYRRLVARRGRQKAIVAVGHHLRIIVYHVLHHGQSYQEPTPTDLDHRRRHRARDRAIAHLRHLGYDVTVTPMPAAA
jgi:transposase